MKNRNYIRFTAALFLTAGLTITGCGAKKEAETEKGKEQAAGVLIEEETEALTEAEPVEMIVIDSDGPSALPSDEEQYAEEPAVDAVESEPAEGTGPDFADQIEMETGDLLVLDHTDAEEDDEAVNSAAFTASVFERSGMNDLKDSSSFAALNVAMEVPEGARDAAYYVEKDLIGIIDFYYEDQPFSFYGADGITRDGLFAPTVEFTGDSTEEVNGTEVTFCQNQTGDRAAYWTKGSVSYGLFAASEGGADYLHEVTEKLLG